MIKKIIFSSIIYLAMPLTSSAGNYLWTEKLGILDMSNVMVTDEGLKGYAITVPQKIEFNNSNSSYRVRNTTNGILSGSAYSDAYGAVSFDGIIIQRDGKFTGVGNGNNSFGQIYVDCTNNQCRGVDIGQLETKWRPVSILDDNKDLVGSRDFSYVTAIFANIDDLRSTNRSMGLEVRAAQDFYIIYKKMPTDSAGDKFILKILAYGVNGNYINTMERQQLAKDFFVKNYGREPKGDNDDRVIMSLVFLMGIPGVNPVPVASEVKVPESVVSVVNPAPVVVTPTKPVVITKPVVNFNFKNDLKLGQKHNDVIELKKILNKLGFYKSKNLDNNFDNITQKAVIDFQNKHKLKCSNGKACGLVGASTRAKLNSFIK